MRGYALVLLVIVAPFLLGAGGLWFWERRKVTRRHLLELEVLLEDLGFVSQESFVVSREFHRPFRRGGDEIDCFSDGGSTDVAFCIQGRSTIVSYLSDATIASLIRNHPEILRGEFDALVAAEKAAMAHAKAQRAR